MKRNKGLSVFVLGVSAALALSACSQTADVKSEAKGGTVSFTVGDDEYAGYNSLLSSTYSTGNTAVNDRMMTSFGYFEADGKWHKGTDLGDYEKVSDDPLTVKYTINDKAVYQGGESITCEDYYMDWVAQNPQWVLDGQKAAGNVDESGNPAPLFDHVSGSDTYAIPVANGPECAAGDKEFTVTYSAPNPDWELIVGAALPSHVMAKKLGLTKQELFDKLKAKDFATVAKLAENWNNWYAKTPGELQSAEEAPSFGPFAYKENGWKAGEYVTLVPNPDWWGEKPAVDELVVRQIAPEGQVQALGNQDVNVIEPQATQDTLDSLAKDDKVKVLSGSTLIWEHLDLNMADSSPFAKSKELREAFFKCVPRQDIVDKLIKPLNPDAVVMNAREYFPTDADYAEIVSKSYDGRYDKVDIEGAKKLVAASGVANPTIRIGYSAPNQRRADEVSLIAASCAQAGIKVEDKGSETFFAPGGELDTGQYEVALFAWSGSGQIVSGANIYKSTGQQNYHNWNVPVVDSEWKKVETSLDPAVHKTAKEIIEKALWDEAISLPLFAHPGIAAHTDGLKNVERNVTQSGVMWNAEKWAW